MVWGVLLQTCFASAFDGNDVNWKITFLGPQGECPEFTPDYARYQGCTVSDDGLNTELLWDITLDRQESNEVRVNVRRSGELLMWSISADIPNGWIVSEIEFPIIKVARDEGSKAVLPMGYGAEFDIPTDGGSLSTRYPSVTGGMQFVLTYSDKGSYYFASQDKSGAGKYFLIKGTENELTFSQKVTTSYAWTSEGHFELPWSTAFAFNEASWDETLLKWYRPFVLSTQWGQTALRDRNVAKWIQDADVWIRPKNMFPEVIDGVRKAVDYYDKGLGVHW